MKKTILVLIIVLQMFTITVKAGDTDEYYAYDDNAKLYTAIIESVTNKTVELKVIHKIKGEVIENEILKLPFFEYNSRQDRKPKIGDVCFVAFVERGDFYSIKTTSTEPKTLKFINHLTNASMNMQGQSIYERIEQKVNDGYYEEAEKRRVNKISKLAAEKQRISEIAKVEGNNNDGVAEGKKQNQETVFTGIVVLCVFIIGAVIYAIRRKTKIREGKG